MNRRSLPQDAVDFMKAAGFHVYMRDRADSYALFADENGIGYVQFDPMEGYSVSTVHVPNRESGTGYQIARHVSTLTDRILEEAVRTVVPHWHRGDSPPLKYAGIEDYRSRGKFEAEYREV